MKETGNFMPEANFGSEVQSTTPEAQAFRGSPNVVVSRGSMLDRITSAVVGKAQDVKDSIKPYVLHVVTATALLAAACSGGDKNNDIRIDTQTSTPTAGAVLEPTPTPRTTPTLSPSNGGGSEGKFPTSTPTATSTPEVKQEVPCVIVPQEYCAQAERVSIPNSRGEARTYLGFKDLPEGTQVSSPVDGFFTIEVGTPQSPKSVITIWVPNVETANSTAGFRGALVVGNIVQRPLKVGEPFGTIGSENIPEGEYSLLFTITKTTPDGARTDEDALRKMAPKAFEKPMINGVQNTDASRSSVLFGIPPGSQPVR